METLDTGMIHLPGRMAPRSYATQNGVQFTRSELRSQLLCKLSVILVSELEAKLPNSSEKLQNLCDQECNWLNSCLLGIFSVHWCVQMKQTGPKFNILVQCCLHCKCETRERERKERRV